MKSYGIITDKELRDEIIDKLKTSNLPNINEKNILETLDFLTTFNITEDLSTLKYDIESIVVMFGRPVFPIVNNSFSTSATDKDFSKVWTDRLDSKKDILEQVIPSVGRIEIKENPLLEWAGTGWLITDDIIVTNRHVALEFLNYKDGKYTFKYNYNNRRMFAKIDFKEELQSPDEMEFNIINVIHIEEDPGPDLAFLQISKPSNSSMNLPKPIKLSNHKPNAGDFVGIIGYPARDSRVPDPDFMNKVFNYTYNVKQLSPGQILSSNNEIDWILTHDCSTLGGNSGSVLLDIETGEAVGLHFGGVYREQNYAISSTKILEILNNLQIH